MVREKKDRRYNLLAFTGSAALLALAINLAISAVNAHTKKRKRRGLFFFFFFPEIYFLPNTSSFCIVHPPFLFNVFLDCMCWCWIAPDLAGSNVRVNLSVPEILQLANSIISKSKAVHDAVGSVPLDKVMRVQCYFLCELFSRCGNIKLLLLLDSFDY